MGRESHLKSVYLVFFLLILCSVGFSLSRGFYRFDNAIGYVQSNDASPLNITGSNVYLHCVGPMDTKLYTVLTDSNGRYTFANNGSYYYCNTNCEVKCNVTSDFITNKTFTFTITNSGVNIAGVYNDLINSSNLDITGTFTPTNTVTYGPNFNGFTYTASAPGQVLEACRYTTSNIQGYNEMPNSMTKNGNSFTTAGFTLPGNGTTTYYVACKTNYVTELASNAQSIAYTLELIKPRITLLDNASGAYLSSIPSTVFVTTDELSKCQVSNTDTGYVYANTNCTSSFGTNSVCSLPAMMEGLNNFYVSCVDVYGNYNNSADNLLANYIVDLTNPSASPNGVTIDVEKDNNTNITWVLTDNFVSPSATGSFDVYNDSVFYKSGVWDINNFWENVTVDASVIHNYNYTIILTDHVGRQASSTIFANVRDTTNPVITATNPLTLTGSPFYFNVTVLGDDSDQCWVNDTGVNNSMSVLSANNYYRLSLLTNGSYFVNFYCNDSSNNVGVQSHYFMVDTLPPIVAKTEGLSFDMNSTANLSYELSDVSGSGNYSYTINNSAYSPLDIWTNSVNITIPVNTNIGVGVWNYTLFFNDSFNNYNYTDLLVSVRDNYAPIIEYTQPLDYAMLKTNPVNFNVNLNEKGVSCDLSLNGGVNNSMTQNTLTNYAYSTSLTDGYYTAEYYCLDEYNNNGYNISRFSIDTALPYLINFTGNLSITMNQSQLVTWYLADNLSPGNYSLLRDNENIINWMSWLNETPVEVFIDADAGLKPYNFTLLFNDSHGNFESDTRIIEVVDDIPPIITIHSPENKAYSFNSILFNVTLNEKGSGCAYALNSTLNISMTNIDDFTFADTVIVEDGVNNLVFSCNDTSDNFGYNSIQFAVDTQPPFVLNRTYNNTVAMNSTNQYLTWILGDAAYPGNYTVFRNETEIGGFWMSWYNNSGNTIPVNTSRGLGVWNYTIFFNDSVGNMESDTVLISVVDNVPPIVSILHVDEYYLTPTIELNASLNELGNECRYRVNGSSYFTMEALDAFNYGAVQTFPWDGNYIIDYNCTDLYNNWGYNSTNATFDFNPPYLATTPVESVFELNSSSILNWTIADTMTTTGYYNVTLNGTLYVDTTQWFNNTVINVTVATNNTLGDWEYVLSFNDSNGHSSSATHVITLQDTTAPRTDYVFVRNYYSGGNWLFSNETVLECSVNESDLWDVDYYEFSYALDDSVWTNITCNNSADNYCNWTIPRETTPFNISCRAVDYNNNTGISVYNNYSGLDLSSPTLSLEPISLINSNTFTLSATTFDAYSGVANVTYWYTNTTGGYLIGINQTNPFNYTWNVPADIDNTFINISASCYDLGGWLSNTDTLVGVPVNAVPEQPVPVFSRELSGLNNSTIILNATGSYDPDFVVDNLVLNYTYQISSDNINYYNVSGCEDINTACAWDTSLTTITCPEYTTCYARVLVSDDVFTVSSSPVLHYVDYTSPQMISLTPNSSITMYGTNQLITCDAVDAGFAVLNMSLDIYMDQGTGNEWYLLNNSATNNIFYNLVFNDSWPNQYGNIIIRCSALDTNSNSNTSMSTGINLDRVGPYFWTESMNVSNGALLGPGQTVQYSIYARDTNPGISQLYFNISNTLLPGSGPVSYYYWADDVCQTTGTNYFYGVYANDTLGHGNTTTFTAPYYWNCDVDSPVIYNCSFSNPGIIYNNGVTRMNCTIQDVGFSTVDEVLFNTTTGLNTPTKSGDYYYQDFTCNSGNNGYYVWEYAFANDSLNNMRLQGVNQIIECDALPPVVGAPITNATGGYQNATVCIEANVSDAHVGSAWLEIGRPNLSLFNATMAHNPSSICGNEDYGSVKTYGYELILEDQGAYNIFNVFANDTGGQITKRPSALQVYVFDNLGPVISDVVIINGDNTLKAWENATLRAQVYDEGINGVDTVLFEFSSINETGILAGGNYYDYTFHCSDWYNEGEYHLTNVFANDTGSNTAVRPESEFITCDAVAPRINNSMVNLTAVTQYDWLCISTNITEAYLDKVWTQVYYNNTYHNLTMNSPSMCGGTHSVNLQALAEYDITVNSIYANDTAGNINYNIMNWLVNVEESLYPQFKCSINDSLLGRDEVGRLTCEIRDNEGINTAWFEMEDFVPPGPSTYSNNTLTNNSIITYVYDFSCNIMAGSFNKTISRVFANDTDALTHTNYTTLNQKVYCDINAPIISNVWYDSSPKVQYDSVCVNATIFEADTALLSSAVEVINPLGQTVSYPMTTSSPCAIGVNSYGVRVNLTIPGAYNFSRIIAQDVVYNTDIEYINYAVNAPDNIPPVVVITSPIPASYNTPNITLAFHADNEIITNYWYVLDAQSPVYLGSGNTNLYYLSNGNHTINAYINDSYGNVGSSSVTFYVNTSTGSTDLKAASLTVPSQTTAGVIYDFKANITNEGQIDALASTINWFIDSALVYTEQKDVFHNTTITLNLSTSLLAGNHNITVIAEPAFGESDLLDNSKTKFTQTSNLISNVTIFSSTPDAVAPNTLFPSFVYEYQAINPTLTVTNLLMPDFVFTINSTNVNTSVLNSGVLNIIRYNLTSPTSLSNYTVASNSWIPGLPGNKTVSENVEVRMPGSPIFSTDIVVIPDFFVPGMNNIVIANVYNYGNETAHNANATLSIPSGINLVSGSLTQNLGDIIEGDYKTAQWTVTPDYAGSFELSVLAVCDEDFASDSSSSAPMLSILNFTNTQSVEINKNATAVITIENKGTIAENVTIGLILGANMSSTQSVKTFNVAANTNYTVALNFSAGSEGDGQSFKVYASHSPSSFYDEVLGSVNVWADRIPPSGVPVLTGYSTVDGFNVIQWTPVNYTFTYYIYKGIDGTTDFNPLAPNATVPGTTTSWIDRSVDMNKWYYYRVAAADEAGNVGTFSEYIRVIPVNTQVLTEEISVLQGQISEYTDIESLERQHLLLQAQVNSDITRMLSDIQAFNNISILLTPQQYLRVNSVKSTLLTAQSKSLISDRRDFLNQAVYEMNQLSTDYVIGEHDLTYSNNIGNLTVSTKEHVLTITMDGKKYNKYVVTKKVINPSNNVMMDVDLRFALPDDAILVEELNVEDATILYGVEVLNPQQSAELTYTFYTYNDYTNNQDAGLMTEIIPSGPARPITGFVVFDEGEEDASISPVLVGVVWSLVFVSGFAYLQKDAIIKMFNKKPPIKPKTDNPKMIEIKIDRD
ncbi:MAG: hypothetical protein JW791_04065 [Nanoarchaeota archaeon]|nr:hypothetical protein [Nanoarchaeota archaeon]